MPSPEQTKLYAGLLPAIDLVETSTVPAVDLGHDRSANELPASREGTSRRLARSVITFYIGVVATLAWQSYGGDARQVLASWSPQLGWLAPQAAAAPTVLDVDEQITRSVDRVIAASQEQIARSVAQLAADQQQMTREIIKLQAISQYGIHKNSEPPARPASAPPPKPVTRPVR